MVSVAWSCGAFPVVFQLSEADEATFPTPPFSDAVPQPGS